MVLWVGLFSSVNFKRKYGQKVSNFGKGSLPPYWFGQGGNEHQQLEISVSSSNVGEGYNHPASLETLVVQQGVEFYRQAARLSPLLYEHVSHQCSKGWRRRQVSKRQPKGTYAHTSESVF